LRQQAITPDLFDLTDTVPFIAGGYGGIGAVIAQGLAQRGARVAIAGRRSEQAFSTARGVRLVDTTHGSSLPVAEWALALMLIGLRNGGEQFRRLIRGDEFHRSTDDPGYRLGELTGLPVGLIGLGHIGRRLIELLAPFRCPVVTYDPYVSKEVALAVHVELAPLERVMAESDVVVCTAPLTSRTQGVIGQAALDLLACS